MTDPRDLVERCIEARIASRNAPIGDFREKVGVYCDALDALQKHIEDESTRRLMAKRARRTAALHHIPADLASSLLKDAAR